MNNGFLIKNIEHIGYTTASIQRTLDLLIHCFGIDNCIRQYNNKPYVSGVTGFKDCAVHVAFLKAHQRDIALEILEYDHPKGERMNCNLDAPGAAHICYETDNLDALIQKMAANGIEGISPIEKVDGFISGKEKGACMRMPDGLVMEFVQADATSGGRGVLTGNQPCGLQCK